MAHAYSSPCGCRAWPSYCDAMVGHAFIFPGHKDFRACATMRSVLEDDPWSDSQTMADYTFAEYSWQDGTTELACGNDSDAAVVLWCDNTGSADLVAQNVLHDGPHGNSPCRDENAAMAQQDRPDGNTCIERVDPDDIGSVVVSSGGEAAGRHVSIFALTLRNPSLLNQVSQWLAEAWFCSRSCLTQWAFPLCCMEFGSLYQRRRLFLQAVSGVRSVMPAGSFSASSMVSNPTDSCFAGRVVVGRMPLICLAENLLMADAACLRISCRRS